MNSRIKELWNVAVNRVLEEDQLSGYGTADLPLFNFTVKNVRDNEEDSEDDLTSDAAETFRERIEMDPTDLGEFQEKCLAQFCEVVMEDFINTCSHKNSKLNTTQICVAYSYGENNE